MSYIALPGQAAARGDNEYRHVRPMSLMHTVKPGETFDSIAAIYGTSGGALRALNGHHVGQQAHPHAGQRIHVG